MTWVHAFVFSTAVVASICVGVPLLFGFLFGLRWLVSDPEHDGGCPWWAKPIFIIGLLTIIAKIVARIVSGV